MSEARKTLPSLPAQADSDVDATRWQLASRMVTTLPAFGNWATRMRDFDTPLGKIGYRQAEVLYCLRTGIFGPDPVSPSTMADNLSVTRSALTRVLNRLALHGFIDRQTDQEDRRAQSIHITPEGEAISVFVERMLVSRMYDAISSIPDERIPAMADHLDVLHDIAIVLQEQDSSLPGPADEE